MSTIEQLKGKDFYRVVMQCFDAPAAAPYPDHFLDHYDTELAAAEAVWSSAEKEQQGLAETENEFGEFVFDDCGEDHEATVRFYEGEPTEHDRDYYDVTLYDIEKATALEGGYLYRGFYILESEKGYTAVRKDIEPTQLADLSAALDFVDDVILNREIQHKREAYGMYNGHHGSFFEYFREMRETYNSEPAHQNPDLADRVIDAQNRVKEQTQSDITPNQKGR